MEAKQTTTLTKKQSTMTNKKYKYTVLLKKGDKIIETHKLGSNLNVAKAVAGDFTLEGKYDTVELVDNETGNFISFDPKRDNGKSWWNGTQNV